MFCQKKTKGFLKYIEIGKINAERYETRKRFCFIYCVKALYMIRLRTTKDKHMELSYQS